MAVIPLSAYFWLFPQSPLAQWINLLVVIIKIIMHLRLTQCINSPSIQASGQAT